MRIPAEIRAASHYTRGAYERFRLGSRPIVLVSNNCWGYELYNALRREYCTPFVGLYIYPECYLSILSTRFPDRLALSGFVETSRYSAERPSYPVGVLEGGEELHFLHYGSAEEARAKWDRRVTRMRHALEREQTIAAFKLCDRDGCEPRHLTAFHALPFRTKVSLGLKPHEHENHLAVPKLIDSDGRSVMDGRSLYRKRYHYFDPTEWLLSGAVRRTAASLALRSIS